MHVVVQFHPWFKFYFLLFLGMVMYDNDFETKEIKFKPRINLNHDIYNPFTQSKVEYLYEKRRLTGIKA